MSRKKGKSSRRIKDWQQQFTAGQGEDIAGSQERLAPKAIKLRGGSFADSQQEDLASLPQAEGMVVEVFRRGAYVRVEGRELFCGMAKTFRAPATTSPLAVGDNVTVALAQAAHTSGRLEMDRERMDGMILSRQPRSTVLCRPLPRSGKRRQRYEEAFEKVIAVNMDVLLVVASVRQPALRPRLIERYLIVAQRGELAPLLAINKTDLGAPDEPTVRQFRDLGLGVILTSAANGAGLEELRAALAGKRSVLVGASGVGKSTLINALVPGAKAATREVRAKDERGRHTTAAAAVYDLPCGGLIVDTPGVRELGVRLDAAELPWYFPEFEAMANRCKFSNCTHTHEPGCAVQAAVEAGQIPPRRFESYLRLLEALSEDLG